MMAFPFCDNITVFNRGFDRDTRNSVWTRTLVRGVSFVGGRAASVSDGGLSPGGAFTVRIPEEAMPEGYLPPETYNKLADVGEKWTVQCGDIVCRGLVEGDITLPEDALEAESLCFTVTGWHDNRGRILGHLRVDGE